MIGKNTEFSKESIIKEIQKDIADCYAMSTISSIREGETPVDSNGDYLQIICFAFGSKGKLSDLSTLKKLSIEALKSVKETFLVGSPVLWRRIPEFIEENNEIQLRFRIGGIPINKKL